MVTDKSINGTPKKIRVGPYCYEVEFDGEDAFTYNHFGVTLFRSRRIKLDPRQSNTEVPQTFLHEVLHALGEAFEIKEWDRHTTNDKQENTDKINLMASVLLQWLRDNPEIVRWLARNVDDG